MEYRGYDSSGIAMISEDKLIVKKGIGKLNEVNDRYKLDSMPGHIGLGHTRWATHGGVTEPNAHPHCDCKKQIAVIHNGIVDNYQELRKDLLKCGHNFTSETDTEVIPHMIEDEIKKGRSLQEAVITIAPRLQGTYAFLAISTREPDLIVGTRKGSPLVIGLGDHTSFAASDSLALAGEINKLLILGEGEVAAITAEKATFYDATGMEIEKQFIKPDMTWTDSDKGEFDYFMLKEIMEQ
ncbi:MAG: glutamine--fructose-6-phosphate aminotransferase, partial [Chloroflexi bacterium]|nr:glutamine--fructose-6-phosphate aminotransferase [Chloroflexota bacterium]